MEPDYVMFGTKKCIFCIRAKEYFERHNLIYRYIDVDIVGRAKVTRGLRGRVNGQKTLPYIFKDQIFIGGYEDLVSNYMDLLN